MSRLTLAFLLLLATGLGYFAWSTLEAQKDDPEAGALSRRLFPDVEREDVTAFRIDHIERNTALRIERDAEGGWRLVDPISAKADLSVIKQLLDIVAGQRGSEVATGTDEGSRQEFLEASQLLPPRAEFEVEWSRAGKTESRTLELGGVDLDARSLVVRDVSSGRILRTLRTIDTELLRNVSEYRDPLLLGLNPERVVELHRTGTESFEAERFGIELHAFQENDGWVSAAPLISNLHPGPMGLLIANVSRLRASYWLTRQAADEFNNTSLFDEPALRLDARYSNGEEQLVEIAVTSGGRWLARASADPLSLAEIEETDAFRLSVPFELLADRRLLRAPFPLIERVIFERSAERGDLLILERDEEAWRVVGPDGSDRPADRVAVRDLLGELERLEFYDLSSDSEWPRESVVGAFQFEGAGETWRIEVGGPAQLEERQEDGAIRVLDTPGVQVRRGGEELVFVAKPELLELLLKPSLESFTNLDLIYIDELDVRSIELKAEARERRWNRSDRGRWTRPGEEAEAFEILAMLDALFRLRAEGPLPSTSELSAPVRVTIRGEAGPLAEYSIGEVLLEDGPRAALTDGETAWLLPGLRTPLHEQLLRLIRAK